MALPRYYDWDDNSQFKKDKDRVARKVSSNLPTPGTANGGLQRPGEVLQEASSEWGSAWDLLGEAAWGFASGLSWGVTEFAEDQEDKPEGRFGTIGRVIGETAGLFAPWAGPFALMGKASAKVTSKLAKEGTEAIVKAGSQRAGTAAIQGAAGQEAASKALKQHNLILETAEELSKTTGKPLKTVLAEIDDKIQKGIIKSTTNKENIKWLYNLRGNVEQRRDALKMLSLNSQYGIKKALKEVGIEDVDPNEIARLSDEFMDVVKNGKPVNDISEWIAAKFAGSNAGPMRDFLSKYMGMAAQDVAFMAIHDLASAKMRATARGEEFGLNEAGHVASHGVIMGLMFPGLRLIPGGGNESLTRKFSLLRSKYSKIDYDKMVADNGEDAVKGLASILARGGKYDLINQSVLGNIPFKVRSTGKVIQSGRQLESMLPNMKIDDVTQLLKEMRVESLKRMNKDWYGQYGVDFFKSAGRMGIGVVAMNYGAFKTGAFNDMNPEELGVHLLMAAAMTKSRGHWGRDAKHEYLADMTPYYEALDLLGVSSDGLKDTIAMYDMVGVQQKFGGAFHTNAQGKELYDAFEWARNNEKFVGNPKEFDPIEHRLVGELMDMYTFMSHAMNQGKMQHNPMDPRMLGREGLNALESRLNNIKFEDGKTFKELGFEGIKSRITAETAEGTWKIYKDMIMRFEELGIKVAELPNNRLRVDQFNWNGDGDMTRTLFDVVEVFRRAGKIEWGPNARSLESGNSIARDNTKLQLADEIIESTKSILNREHGVGIYNFDIIDNPYVKLIESGQRVGMMDAMFNMMRRQGNTPDYQDVSNLGTSADDMFFAPNEQGKTRYLDKITDYEIDFTKKGGDGKELIKTVKGEDPNQRQERADDVLNILDPLFQLMKTGTGAPIKGGKKKISYEDAQLLAQEFSNIKNRLPHEIRNDMLGEGVRYYTKRFMESRGYDRRALNAVTAAKEYFDFPIDGDGRFILQSLKAFTAQVKKQIPNINDEQLGKFTSEYQKLLKSIGSDHYREIDFEFGDSRAEVFRDFNVRDIFKITKELDNGSFVDFLNFGKEAIGKLSLGANFKAQNDLFDIQIKFKEIEENLGKAGFKPQDALKELENIIDAMNIKDRADMKGHTGFEANRELYNSIKENMRILRKRLETVKKADDVEQAILDFKDDGADRILSINETISNLINRKIKVRNRMTKLINQIINKTTLRADGFSPGESREYYNTLTKELAKEIKGLENKEVTFAELIELYNQQGGWDRFMDISENLIQRINMNRAMKDPLHQTFEDIYQSLETQHTVHTSSESPIVIAKRYNLLDQNDSNIMNQEFVELASNNLWEAREFAIKQIREMGRTNNMSDADVNQKIRDFVDKDGHGLFLGLSNKTSINEMNFLDGVVSHGEAPGKKGPNETFFKRSWDVDGESYDMFYINDSIVISSNGGAPRKISLNELVGRDGNTPNTVHTYIQEMITSSKMAPDVLRKFILERMTEGQHSRNYDIQKTDLESWRDASSLVEDYLVYMRLSPKLHTVFVASDKNIQLLNNDYDIWYDKKLKEYGGKNTKLGKAFVSAFGEIAGQKLTNKNLELKMLTLHSDYMMRGEFNKMIKQISEGEDMGTVRKTMANMYKRGFISDGGTTNVINNQMNELLTTHPDPVVKSLARKFALNPESLGALMVKDEGLGGADDPFHIRHRYIRALDQVLQDPNLSEQERVIAQQSKERAERRVDGKYDVESLEASVLDGSLPISESLARYLWAAKGRDLADFNGLKPVIMSVGEGNNLLGKGFFFYDPKMKFAKDVHILVPESSAKSLDGLNRAGNPIEYLDLANKGLASDPDINNLIVGRGSNVNIMDIRFDSIGLGFTGKDVNGVTISNSTGALENYGYISALRSYQKMDNIIDKMHIGHMEKARTKEQLAQYLYQLKADQGFEYSQGQLGLARALINSRASINNPLVKETVNRLIRSKDFQIIRRPNTDAGEDVFIIPNMKGDLKNGTIVSIQQQGTMGGAPTAKEPILDRLNASYGEIGVGHGMMDRIKIGMRTDPTDESSPRRTNIGDFKFIYSDNGIDVIANYSGGKKGTFESYSRLYDEYSGQFIKGTNVRVGTKDKAKANFVKDILKVVDSAARDNQLSLLEIHNLIKDGIIVKNGNDIILEDLVSVQSKKKITQADIDKLNLALGSSGVAIPLKGYDKGIHRVGKILDKEMNGLVEINDYDQRVMHQRDNDGDHFYVYMDKPWQLMKKDASVHGRIKDYLQFQKGEAEANQYGFNKDMVAGGDVTAVGHQAYSATIHQRKRAIGSTIGDRDIISWLQRVGFMNKTQGTSLYNLNDISNLKDGAVEFGIAERFVRSYQSGVDVFPGVASNMAPDAIRDYVLFGTKPRQELGQMDPLLEATSSENIFKKGWSDVDADGNYINPSRAKGIAHWTDLPIGRKIIDVVFRTMKKANSITNEVHDDAGSRPPEPHEIGTYVSNLRKFFADPNKYLVNEIRNDIMSNKSMSTAKKTEALEELVKFFYGYKPDPVINKQQTEKFISDLWKGKFPTPKKRFQFNDDIRVENPGSNKQLKAATTQHLGAETLRQIAQREFYTDEKYAEYDISKNKMLYRNAGIAVNDIVERIDFLKTLGEDVEGNSDKFSLGNLVQLETSVYQNDIVNRGLIKNILETEYADLNKSLRYLREERFTNPLKIERIRHRIDKVHNALNVINKQHYEGLVANPRTTIRKPVVITEMDKQNRQFTKRAPAPQKRTFVYRVHKNYWKAGDDNQINFKKIQKVGWFGPKERQKTYDREEGYYYLETTQPAIRESVSTYDAKYSDALHRLTLNIGDATRAITDYHERIIYHEDVMQLKAEMTGNYSDVMGQRLKGRVGSDLGWEMSKAKDDMLLNDFFMGTKNRKGWIEKLEDRYGMDAESAYTFILHNILQPSALAGRYKPYTAGKEQLDLPFYSMNKRLSRILLRYYTDKGLQPIVDKFVKNWESLVDGDSVNLNKYMEASQAMYGDKYNYNKLDESWSFAKSLTNGPGSAIPYLEINLDKAGLEYVRTSIANTGSGDGKYILRNKKYSSGRGCGK